MAPSAKPAEMSSGPLGSSVQVGIRRVFASRRRKVLAAVTLLLGLVGAMAVTVGTPPALRTFAFASLAVQLLMSVTVPFLGVLLTSDLAAAGPGQRLAPRLLAAAVLALAFAAFGIAVSAGALAVAPSDAVGGGWQDFGAVALGSALVQLIAQFAGTGLGLLIRRPAVAMIATIVLPLGLWLVLGSVAALRPAQGWLAPFTSAGNLLSGEMAPVNWAQSLVVVLIWNVGLNVWGAHRLRRPRPARRRG